MDIHILRTAVQPDGEKLTLTEMREKMPRCPICGKKAYLDHSIVNGFDFGYDAGCPSFCLNDGVHGISESHHQDAPHIHHWSADGAFTRWNAYCERMKKKEG